MCVNPFLIPGEGQGWRGDAERAGRWDSNGGRRWGGRVLGAKTLREQRMGTGGALSAGAREGGFERSPDM